MSVVGAALDLVTVDVARGAQEELAHARNQLPATSPHGPADISTAGAQWLTAALGESGVCAVTNFRTSRDMAILIRGTHLSTEVDTPATGFLPDKQCIVEFDLLLFGMLKLMGIRPFAVDFENEGKFVRNVVPVANAARTTSSWGADVEFSWHTDNPNWPFRSNDGSARAPEQFTPTFLAFTAVRNAERVSTDLVSGEEVLSRLPSSVNTELRRAAYCFDPPASNEFDPGKRRVLPVVEDSITGPRIRFDDGAVSATDDASSAALAQLRATLRQTEGISLVLETGDFFILKNEKVLHRRKQFIPLGGGRARWLRRCYGC